MANSSAMVETLRIWSQLVGLMATPRNVRPDARPPFVERYNHRMAFTSGACICGLFSVGKETPVSPSTAIGSAVVATGHGAGELAQCSTTAECPRAQLGTSGLVNPAPTMIVSIRRMQISSHSLMKRESWKLISYMHEEDVQFELLIQRAVSSSKRRRANVFTTHATHAVLLRHCSRSHREFHFGSLAKVRTFKRPSGLMHITGRWNFSGCGGAPLKIAHTGLAGWWIPMQSLPPMHWYVTIRRTGASGSRF